MISGRWSREDDDSDWEWLAKREMSESQEKKWELNYRDEAVRCYICRIQPGFYKNKPKRFAVDNGEQCINHSIHELVLLARKAQRGSRKSNQRG